jgi:hypothetical protein
MCPALRQIQPNLVLQQFLGEPQWSGALKVLYLNATFATNIKIKKIKNKFKEELHSSL